MKKLFTIIAVSFVLFGFSSGSSSNGGTPLYATLLGPNEVPTPGDPDGAGWAELRLNQGQGTISYHLYVEGIEPPRAAHIHIGVAGTPGGVVVPLMAPTNGMSMGVAEVDPELIKEIRKNPGNYYVNVHNAPYPGGALRGQLMK
jgi:CHRD domain